MKLILRRLSLFFVFLVIGSASLVAQPRAVKKAERKQAQIERKEERAANRAIRNGKKRHLEVQSDDVRKRIKKNKKMSSRYGREPFYKRWFKRKKPKR